MKTLQIILCFLLLGSPFMPLAQISLLPAPESQPVWTVEENIYGNVIGIWQYWYGSEEELCDTSWQVIYAQRDCGPVQTLGWYREEGLKGWLRTTRLCEDHSHLLFDFTLEARDTFRYIPVSIGLAPPAYPLSTSYNFFTVLSKTQLPDGSIEMSLWDHAHGEGRYWRTGLGASDDPFRMFLRCWLGGSCHYHSYLLCVDFQGEEVPSFSGGYFRGASECEAVGGYGRLYVNAQAEGPGTGYSWANAFPDLQSALAAASCGTEIWVAEGTYRPSATTDRNASFRIPTGVRVYGGFQGTETNLAQRDYTQNLTLLSGELGDTSLRTDNSYHVVTFLGTDTTTVLDGFTISGGYAVATPNPDVPVGGGILAITDADNPLTECRIENCQIINNTAAGGGGVACIGYPQPGEDWRAYPRFKNCAISNNHATSNGGGIYFRWLGHPRADVPLLEDCVVRENRADNQGGGLYVDDLGDHLYLRGTAIEANSTELDGGGIFAYQILGQFPSLSIDSCSISYNEADAGGALYYPSILTANYQDAKTEVIIHHSVLIGNVARSEGGALYCDMGGESIYQFDIAHSTFENNSLLNQTGSDGAVAHLVFGDNADVLVEVDHCSFIGNTHNLTQEGRGIIQLGAMFGYAEITSRFTNCLFADNVMGLSLSSGIGGAIQENTIANCTFYNNGPKPCVTSWNPDEPSQNHTLFYNNVVWEPQAENPVRSGFTSLNSVSLHHNLFSSLDCTLPGGDTACGEGNIIGLDPLFLDAAAGDFRTATCSPARNSGSMAAITELGLLTDLAGEPRLLDGRVDMGAHEQAAERWELAGIAPVTCYGSNSGSVQLDTLHVALPAQAHWLANDGSMSSGLDNLPAGMLDLWLEDALGCRDTFSVTIPGPTPIQFSSTLTNATTAQSMDGGIAVFNLTGGQPPYQYVWSTGDTTATLQAIPAGDYELSITDALGCTVDYIFTVDHTTGVSELLAEHGVQLYPNPVQAGQSFQLKLTQSFSDNVNLLLFDALSRHLATYTLPRGIKENWIPALGSGGTYFMLFRDMQGQVLGTKAFIVK